jgi:hypothetical protein
VPQRARIYVLAIVVGLVAEGLLVLVIDTVGGEANGASILLVLQAIILGWVFGAWPGVAGTTVPILVFLVVDLASGNGNGSEITLAFAAVLILGFCAWLPGVLRERYGRTR